MTSAAIIDELVQRWGPAVLQAFRDGKHPRVHVNAADWRSIAVWLRHQDSLRMDWLADLGGIDYAAQEQMAVVYDLWSFDHHHRIAIKVFTPRSNPVIPSVVDLWAAANWHEREAFDLLGIRFDGHPNLSRILLADDWDGFPLRKDYIFPRQVNGIPASVELDWQQNG